MKITIKNLQKKIPIYPPRIRRAILKALSLEKARNFESIIVCFSADTFIKKMNQQYLGKKSPTDVIAFVLPADTGRKTSLEMVVSADTAKRNARIYKSALEWELCLYVVHGILHALGYNDNTMRKRQLMQARAERILSYVYS